MRFHQVPTFSALPQLPPKLDHEDEQVIAESDLAFDRLVQRLSELYLLDSGDGQQGAVIHMNRYFEPCRRHTVVVDEPAWHPDVVIAMHHVLRGLPDGWSFGIDATEFPPGQAHIVVTQSGDVYGWSDYRARHTLASFGFKSGGGPLLLATSLVLGSVEAAHRAWRLHRLRNKAEG
jgi:hypothetical protein